MTVFDWMDVQITEALAQALLHSLWQGVLIVSLLVIGDQMGIARSAERKYLFYMSGLILLFISSVVSFLLAFYWPQEVQANTFLTPFNSLIHHNAGNESSISAAFFWQGALVIAWFTGFIYQGCKNAIGSLRLFQLRRKAQNAPMHWQRRVGELSRGMHIRTQTILLSTKEISIPFVMGVMHPVIMFPANYFVQLTPSQIEVILTHELAHIGRNDYLLNVVQIIIECLLFFNPATWWLSKRIRRQREFCCDDRVQTNLIDQKIYLEALYNVARISTKLPASSIALFDNNSELIMRMKRISSTHQPQRSLRSLVIASIGLLTVFGLFAFNTMETRSNKSTNEAAFSEAQALSRFDFNFNLNSERSIDLGLLDAELDKIVIVDRQPDQLVDVHRLTELLSAEALNAISVSAGQITSTPLQDIVLSTVLHTTSSGIKQIAADTNPPSSRMLELQAQMEELSGEMENMAEEMQEVIEGTVEAEVEKIESLAEQMELIAEKYESKIEDSPEMQRLEKLSELLDEKMESIEERVEDMDEGTLEELQELMESKAKQYEDFESLTDEQREKLTADMKALSDELQTATKDMYEQYSQLMENPEIKKLQEEMEDLGRQLSRTHENMQPMNEDMLRLQDEMQQQQQLIHEKMQGAVAEMQNALNLKAEEMKLLQQELYEEMHKSASQKKND
jgi:bla regulator protein blaR1